MIMKCLYAIPAEKAREASSLCEAYSAALEFLPSDTVALADDLRAFAESSGSAVLKLDDEDWASTTEGLSQPSDRDLAGELFWSPADAQRLRRALDEGADWAAKRTVSAWLGIQASRGRSFILVVA